jgi:hypothetical protein
MSNLYDFVITIISNKDRNQTYNNYLDTLTGDDKKYATHIYKLINSNNFLELVKTLNLSKSDLQAIKEGISELVQMNSNTNSRLATPFLIYSSIVSLVNRQLETEKRGSNTSVAYLTANNVQRSEDIESFGVKSFNSITNIFTNFKTFRKNSMSPSIVFTAELTTSETYINPMTFYFKMFPIGQVKKDDNKMGTYDSKGLEFELKAYNEVFKLAKYNITPNILCKIVSGTFTNIDKDFLSSNKLSNEFVNRILIEMKSINNMNNLYDTNTMWNTTGILMTNPGGTKLEEVFKTCTKYERKQIMFQILYTFYVFEKLQISHGDLHFGNIFVIDVEPTELSYMVDGVQYRFTTTKLVKIYDFDFGLIGKDTNIRLNTKSKFRINRILNPDRWQGTYLNNQYGESEYFNKNLDLCILYFLSFKQRAIDPTAMVFLGTDDIEFDDFIQESFPGFYNSTDTISNSLKAAFTNEVNRKEASVVFNKTIRKPEDVNNLEIGAEILNITWRKYYTEFVLHIAGRLVKSAISSVNNNQLWIPDNVIIPKSKMLKLYYFSELIDNNIDINVRKSPIYTIDGKIID